MSTTEITWAEPPASKTSTGWWRPDVVEQLQQYPGRWALVEQATNGGRTTVWKKLGCECVSRSTGDGNVDVYARWPEERAVAA